MMELGKKAGGQKPSIAKRLRHIERMAWLFTVPGLVIFSIFKWYPTILSFFVSLQKYRIRGSTFIGLGNFETLISDPMVWLTFRNTFYYAFLCLALVFLVPIIVSILLLEMKKKVIRIMMILWFIPIGSMASIVLWKWFYNPQYGLFNGILTSLGLPTSRWLSDSRITMLCIVLPGLIMFGPGLVYIASLQGIPDELYEAADLEGAGFWQKIWHISLPRIRPMLAMMLILAVIGYIRVFNQPFVMTGGGPGDVSRTVVMYIYQRAFTKFQLGYATAIMIIVFFILMGLIYIQRRFFKENIDV